MAVSSHWRCRWGEERVRGIGCAAGTALPRGGRRTLAPRRPAERQRGDRSAAAGSSASPGLARGSGPPTGATPVSGGGAGVCGAEVQRQGERSFRVVQLAVRWSSKRYSRCVGSMHSTPTVCCQYKSRCASAILRSYAPCLRAVTVSCGATRWSSTVRVLSRRRALGGFRRRFPTLSCLSTARVGC
jgi:hypothetical protein